MTETLLEILEAENLPPTPRVTAVCDAIRARHPGRIQAFLYYGSSLRDMENPEKMLDFYVLVDSYKKTHKTWRRALLNAWLPPAVYYYESRDENGVLSTCKYSLLSLEDFEKKCSDAALLSQIWGRFSQPSTLLFPLTDLVKSRVMNARIAAVKQMSAVTLPLINSPVTATQFWARGYRESYRTELRPEASESRSEEIVERYGARYHALLTVLYGPPDASGLFHLPIASPERLKACQRQWRLRRWIGKPMTALRVINSAATFDGGLEYVLRKLHNHSGVTIETSSQQRKHPVLWSPVLGWKLWRKGAFR